MAVGEREVPLFEFTSDTKDYRRIQFDPQIGRYVLERSVRSPGVSVSSEQRTKIVFDDPQVMEEAIQKLTQEGEVTITAPGIVFETDATWSNLLRDSGDDYDTNHYAGELTSEIGMVTVHLKINDGVLTPFEYTLERRPESER